jgi:hypothetical protein
MRSFAIEYAWKVNRNIDDKRANEMAQALAADPSLPRGCSITLPVLLPTEHQQQAEVEALATESAPVTFFADAIQGDDTSGDGTMAKPFKSVGRALAATRQQRPLDADPQVDANASGPVINLRAGTYFLSAPLSLTASDSGLTIQTYPGDTGRAWLSGARPLPGLAWSRVNATGSLAGANLWAADLSSASPGLAEAMSLRVDGERAVLARYPNCNPEKQLCMAPVGYSSS